MTVIRAGRLVDPEAASATPDQVIVIHYGARVIKIVVGGIGGYRWQGLQAHQVKPPPQ